MYYAAYLQRVVMLSILVAATASTAADWPQFRGPSSNSVSREALPTAWGESENLAWKADLPGRGPSSPIVVGDRVFVTCSSGVKQDRLHVVCFDAASGKQLWERQFWATGRTLSHPTSANAAPTPASDGRLVFAFFSSNDLIALDLDGNLAWLRGLAYDFPHAGNDVGMASSPLVVGDVLVVQVEAQGDSFAIALDRASGESRWRIERSRESNWSSPVAMNADKPGSELVLLQSPGRLSAHDAATGRERWSYQSACDAISSATVIGNTVYVASKGMTALDCSLSTPAVLWNVPNLQPGAASTVVDNGKLYIVNRAGVLVCADAADGKILWRVRLEGEFWGSPASTGNALYAINQKGLGFVVRASEDGKRGDIVGKGQIDGTIQSSPALAHGAIYVRSDQHLWKIMGR